MKIVISSLLNSFAFATLNALAAHIALVDSDGAILAVNDSWRDFAEANSARSNVMEGVNYLTVCTNARGRDAHYAQSFGTALKDVLVGDLDEFALEYPCHAPNEQRWFIGRISRFTDSDAHYAVVAHENITERKLAEEQLIRQTKEEALIQERQRISRELHDGVNQVLFSSLAISQSIPRIFEKDPARIVPLFEEIVHLNRAALSEMRILLNELRPNSIINTPLPTLMHQLADTITHRMGAAVNVVVNGEEFHLQPEVHFGIYRIAQESINNILKHSEAQNINITLTYFRDQTSVLIEDDGRGFEMRTLTKGIGFRSIEERAAEIKASLDIIGMPGHGTKVSVLFSTSEC